MIYDFKAEIIKSKSSSSSKSGAHHWLLQRVTGVVLALCSFWLIYFMFTNKNNDINIIMWEFKKPFNIVILLITVTISLYHSVLGMRVVIEDYINCHKLRNTLIIIVKLFCILTIVAFIVAIFYSE
ncbi:succinate dehydrogenase, hydrophobic membrane anchor protein [Rickettsia typhi]|uniref:Succinate dehydrogenase hydrophobic membrane anchor subunit n=2 Tax=Rickettsia typhi TaxID=785 RepID=DHSD_RICTY|nr:succinate dehydrogenase, hydrophobic membrane anchor protein [Rickettsia typhi]Q68XP0.1 RecName: Full=Succinate dehydrogenase hydrophobic membrane anchor subunit [Rickettsia typhi str. Wilmington]AAU03602.1 succinate dehydrogenase hydrophobic membrane anchor protein [Rickettsia typhi str. Wilmington]AFE53981.1 succinate dehydrogenase hydrophobic membrane anchor protein [Rickettsia typhi str. TH1527]AFE54820.1 succinate dehydrogenase hydrophobic membrane anchor protein [Rickettsia typhi str. 